VKLAFVVQRYGEDIGGGSELHCRWLAEELAGRHQVEVFTTRARDYVSWADSYPAGSQRIGPVLVHRYGVARERRMRRFASLSNLVFREQHSREEERAWVEENGPCSPALLAALLAARERFDAFVFYCFRYYQTALGLPPLRERALLVPTAEDDPALRLGLLQDVLRSPRALAYLTPEEQQLVESASGNAGLPSAVIGSGIRVAPDAGARLAAARPFVLYLGRVDKNKGCVALFAHWQRLCAELALDVDLLLAGPLNLEVPDHPRIRHLGFLGETEKSAALRQCLFLVMPSPYESLSMVVLEAWARGVPVLVNGRCRPLQGQCRRSGGGLWYDGHASFVEAARLLLERPELRQALGRQGADYVRREYAWEVVVSRFEGLLAQVAARPGPG
jgi:glycosyltransferase involved in cell wall biosynthesis